MSFEAALAELEQVVARLERATCRSRSRSRSTPAAPTLRAHCEEKLKAAEARVAEIAQGPDGALRARPVEIP